METVAGICVYRYVNLNILEINSRVDVYDCAAVLNASNRSGEQEILIYT